MSLKGGWALANLLAFFARVIQWLFGFTVDHPGTMFCNTVFNIVGFCSGDIVGSLCTCMAISSYAGFQCVFSEMLWY